MIENKEKQAMFVSVIVLLVLAILFFNPIAIVGVGERGVKVTLGRVSDKSFS